MGDSTTIRRHPLTQAIARSARSDCRLAGGERLVIAISGGADSVALLRALHALADQREWSLDLHVAHVHHHLRQDADSDAGFVAELARRLGLPHHRRDVHPRPDEDDARRMRYAALREVASETDADAVVTAHHANDQLETMLMRLLRGASVRGLAGIRPRRRLDGLTVLRPMLRVSRDDVLAFLGDMDQPWREDHTNRDTTRVRARLRAEVLPVLADVQPDAAVKANDCADQLGRAAAMMRRLAARVRRRCVRRAGQGATMDRAAARRLDRAVLGAVIRRVCRELGAPPDQLSARAIDPIADAAGDDRGEVRTFTLAAGLTVEVNGHALTWRR